MATRLVRRGIIAVGMLFLAIVLLFICNNTVNVKAESLPDNMAAITGVEVKYNEAGDTVSGLRFKGRINKSLVDGTTGIEYGMLFLPQQLYVNDASINYGGVGYGGVAKANCTGNIESDGDYYNIAVYLSGIESANYNCDYYALIYIKDGSTCQYSVSAHASIAETAKYLLDNNLDEDHRSLLEDFILKYPVRVYGASSSLLETIYVPYGETVEALPTAHNVIEGYTGYIFQGWVTTSGGNVSFDTAQSIKGSTNVYAKYDGGHAGVVFKDVDMGSGDRGTVDIDYQNGELITIGTSSQQWNGILSFSNTAWNNYLSAQTAGNKIMTMDIKFGGAVSLSGYVQPTKNELNVNQLRTRTDYFRFYSGNNLVAYNNLAIDTWYTLEIDINAIKNLVGAQAWNGSRSGVVLSRESEGTISVKNLAFMDKYDLSSYAYSSVTNFDEAKYNTDEWYWKSTRDTDGVGLYATEDAGGNGFLYFDGAATNSTFGTQQKHRNFELSFDVYGAKTDNSVAANGAPSKPTSDLRISFGNGTGSVSDRISGDSAISDSVNLRIYQNGAAKTGIQIYDTGSLTMTVSPIPEKYGFFSSGYTGKNCRIKIRVSDGKVSVYIKHVDEKKYTTLINQYSMKDPTMEGYVILRGYCNRDYSKQLDDRTEYQSTHCKIDNIVLGNLTTSMSVSNTPNSLNPPAEVVYTPRDKEYLNYPTTTAQ